MDKNIYKIGKLRYLLTILFGTHRQIVKETIEFKNDAGESKSETRDCDYIITMGRKSVIMTIEHPLNPKMRLAYVVKRWNCRRSETNSFLKEKTKLYIDNDGFSWVYTRYPDEEILDYFEGKTSK